MSNYGTGTSVPLGSSSQILALQEFPKKMQIQRPAVGDEMPLSRKVTRGV